MFPLRDNIPTKSFPIVNYLLIIANLAIFIKEVQLSSIGHFDTFIFHFGFVPSRFLAEPLPYLSTLFSSIFLHGSWGHVLGNMWYLYIFGDNVEDNLGHVRYLFYYVLMGVGATGAQMLANPHSTLPMVGASGAIAGILGSYFVLYPRARVLSLFVIFIFIRIVEIPAFFFLGFWFLMQAISGLGTLGGPGLRGDMGGVAWWAHAGGFMAGFLCIPFFRKQKRERA